MNTNRLLRCVVFLILVLSLSAASFGQIGIGISVRFGPPALPVYVQPACPGPGYIWTPGYWGWDDDDGYYWVPGSWVLGPVGLLWTPGYWGWGDGLYVWYPGYWGPVVGFYGGINYGFGYTSVGFFGGEWRGGTFFYNRSVTNINVTNITNLYTHNVVVNNNHVSFNGGPGGTTARPTPEQARYASEHHTAPLAAQIEQARLARANRSSFASVNHGRPAIAATSRPGEFSGQHVVAAKAAGGTYHAPAMSPREARAQAGTSRAGENRAAEAKGNSQNVNRGKARSAARENGAQERQSRIEQQRQKAEQQQARQQEQRQLKAEQQARQQEQHQQKAEQQQARQQEQRQQKAEQQQARQQEQRQQKAEQQHARQQEQPKQEESHGPGG